MSITPNDFRPGMFFDRAGELMQVIEYQHVKPGKGPAFVRAKLRRVKSGAIFEEKLRPEEKFEEVRIESRKFDYLYSDGDLLVLMDKETFDQIQVPAAIMGRQQELLAENEELTVALHGEEPLSVELPMTVVREIVFCEPGVRGDTATGATKPATVAGGAVITVPLFVNQGDLIKIDTRTFSYLERAK